MLIKTVLAAAFAGLISTAAFAGDQYVDKTGYAASGYDVVAYFDLQQSKVGQSQPEAIPGRAEFSAEYNGAKFAFASQANLDKFKADPAAYAPQFDGHCAYGVAQGGKVPGNPNLWRIVDGKLYLNINKSVVGFWEGDIPGNISVAGKNWKGGLEPQAASNSRIPKFTSAAPIAN